MAEAMITAWEQNIKNEFYNGSPPVIGNACSDAVTSVGEIYAFYERCSLQQLATDTIVAELLKDTVTWINAKGEATGEITPTWVPSLISEATRNLAVTGWLAWRIAENGNLQLAGPQDMTIAWDPTNLMWVPFAINKLLQGSDGWMLSFVAMPSPPLGVTVLTPVAVPQMRSACKRSMCECQRAMQIEAHWITRDRHNSAPGVFTTVTGALGVPMNRNLTGANTLTSNFGPSIDHEQYNDFNDLIHRRAAKYAAMEDMSERDKSRIQAQQMFEGYELTSDTAAHAEHVITDGRAHTEAKSLVSLADSGYVYNRARHNAMMLMGCPPQALGESVNSERTAANHAQYATALATFKSTVDLYRGAITEALTGGTTRGHRLAFKRCLGRPDLDHLLPVLTVETAIEMYACTYMLPKEAFSSEGIKIVQQAGAPKDVGERTLTNSAKESGENANSKS